MAHRGGGPRRPMKGFRPGKEPPQLRRRMAKEQFSDLSPAQERMVELFAERSPEEARALVRRWRLGLLAGGAVLAALAAVLFVWSWIAGVIVAVLAAVVLFFGFRLHLQREGLDGMIDAVSGPGRGRRGRKRGR